MQADDSKPDKSDRIKLSKDAQRRIVTMLACYIRTPVIIETIEEEFRTKLSRQNINHYNPEHNPKVAQEWKDLFKTTRAAYLEDGAACGIAHLAFRNHLYQELLDSANGPAMKLQIAKQAAMDNGGLFTNKRTIKVDPREALAKLIGCSPDDLPPDPSTHA